MWWQNLTTLQQVYFCIAMLFSVILLIQFILMLIGIGGDGEGLDLTGDGETDISVDTDSGLAMFTLKGMIAFFAVGGWIGFTLGDGMMDTVWVILISIASGLVALIGVGFLMKSITKLQQSGTMDIKNAVGKVADVYLTIPANCSATGKITVELQGQLTELDAVTEDQEPIKTGAKVKVVKTDDNTCYVEKLH